MTTEEQLQSTINRLELLKQLITVQRDEVVGFYNELRQVYYDKTGIEFQPTSTIRNRVAPSDEDRAWLKSIGIEV